mmetsp:Transcript_3218/g.10880  ORF Transcript_3218/g.10880 Transcript_3218/m.10880 type:complete len:211 (-) Transcript_3218:53-685(-)
MQRSSRHLLQVRRKRDEDVHQLLGAEAELPMSGQHSVRPAHGVHPLAQQGRPVEGEAAYPEVDRPLYLQLLRAGGMVRRERELLDVLDLLLNIVELQRYELQLLVDAACFLVQSLAAGAWTVLIALELGSLAGRARDGASLPGNVLISDSDAEVCHVGRNASGARLEVVALESGILAGLTGQLGPCHEQSASQMCLLRLRGGGGEDYSAQ